MPSAETSKKAPAKKKEVSTELLDDSEDDEDFKASGKIEDWNPYTPGKGKAMNTTRYRLSAPESSRQVFLYARFKEFVKDGSPVGGMWPVLTIEQ